MKKIGRNEPCPCGSGKKYKKCCYGMEPVSPQDFFDRDALKKYQEMVENWDFETGQPPTFMEYMGKPSMATEAVRELGELADERNFQSEEELRSFIEKHTEEKNNQPLDEFLGLSSRQMNYILNSSFDDIRVKEIVTINRRLFGLSVKDVPALKQCFFLLENIGVSDRGIKATQKGNLPRALVQEFYNTFVKENDIFSRKPMTESDVKDIQKAKFFLRDSGFIKYRLGRYSLTVKGRKMMDDFDPVAFYFLLFEFFTEAYNWLYGTGYPNVMEFLQLSLIFCFYLIEQKAADFVLGPELAEIYLNAFPSLVENYNHKYGENLVKSCFEHLFLEDFAYYMGLVHMKKEKDVLSGRGSMFKKTKLFNDLFIWKI